MDVQNAFERLKQIVEANPDFVDVGSAASADVIAKAEAYLGVSFPESLKLFFSTWGTLAVGPHEYYGIVGNHFEDSKIPDGVWFTAVKRDLLGLPFNFFVLFNNEGDELHCVDLETEEVKSWDTVQKDVVSVKSTNLFDYIADEARDFL